MKKKVPLCKVIIFFAIVVVLFMYFQLRANNSAFYAVQLEDGETWYGKIIEKNDDFLTLDEVYHFNDENSRQLIRHDPNIRDPKEFNYDHIVSVESLAPASPVLRAIRKYEKTKK